MAGYRCSCANGFTGTNCEAEIMECSSNPCQNGATCSELLDGYLCKCANGFTGTHCQTEILECSSNPCKNGASCAEQIAGYRCFCAIGFTGTHCELEIMECSSNPCKNGAICSESIGGYRCNCAIGFTGTHCETDIMECSSNPCKNGAICSDLIGGYRCNCANGFTGTHCETEILECSSSPCQNGATCSEQIGGYRCNCVKGFIGTHCATVFITRCERSECSNAGTCTQIGNNITCTCDVGFTGERCDTANFCEAVNDDYGSWPKSIVATIAQVPCTSVAEKGTYYRTCLKAGWGQVINNCSINHDVIVDLDNTISGLNSTSQEDKLLNITKTLNTVSNNSKITDDLRDLKDIAKASEKLVDYIENNIGKITDNITNNMLGTISNFLDANKQQAWDKINTEMETTSAEELVGAATVLSLADRFMASLRNSKCNALDINSTELKDNKNMYVELGLRSQSSVQFPAKKSFGSSVEIPQQSITGLSQACYIGAIYPTIGAVLEEDVYVNGSWQNGSEVTEVNSDVVGIQVKNFTSENIDPPVTITLSLKKTGYTNPVCVFWDFNITRSGRRGGWSTEGCILASITNITAKCQCNHLTNFAILMSPSTISPVHAKALGIVSAVGCAVSIVCLIITLVIHALVWRLVRSDRVIVVMHLCVALLFALIFFLGGVNRTESRGACVAIAAAIQYFFLAMFFMMLLIGLEILICVVRVFMTKFRTKVLVPLAWIIPGIIVGVSLGVSKTQGYGNSTFCWLDISSGLIWSFVGPALFIICVNILVVIVVLKRMSSLAAMKTKTETEKLKTGLYSICVLLPVVGLTWVFGVLAINDDMWIFQYIFAILNGLQGFFIFLFYCVLNRQVRDALRRRQDRKRSLQTLSSDLRKQSHSASQEKRKNSKTPEQPVADAQDDSWMRGERRQYHRNIRLTKQRRLSHL
ncbi:adhesion G protein-coupled receptor L4-like [Dreissena polymorpha]|uniref:adhesion G protein-coupled receptor L4-like n=1 Tax=Dreissena polymorpha TaxID=45954 RepID=UPI0022650011|nr:adhesion G protein-coupled receptor L4-like [Dreissena polymorpha]